MPHFDPHSDPAPILTAHERLAQIAGNAPTTQDFGQDASTGILSFPDEMLHAIFQYVSRDWDLAQVCKVCERFFAVALPRLYRTLCITIKPDMETFVLNMLTRENTGLGFVRYVHVYTDKHFCDNISLSFQYLRVLINHLPVNNLREFNWHGRKHISPDIVRGLWQRQRNLHYLEIIPVILNHEKSAGVDTDFTAQIKSPKFPSLKYLCVFLDTPSSALTANAALKCSEPFQLIVEGLLWAGGDPYEYKPKGHPTYLAESSDEAESDDDSKEGKHEFPVVDPLTASLFRHLPRVKAGLRPPSDFLTCLILKDINLTLSKHTWFTYLNLEPLIYLKIKYCKGADVFLDNLATNYPALEELQIVHWVESHGDRMGLAINELLRVQPVNHLHTIKICLRNTTKLPNADEIWKHRGTFKRFLVDVSNGKYDDTGSAGYHQGQSWSNMGRPHSSCYSLKDLQTIIRHCKELEELALAFPTYNIHFTYFCSTTDKDNSSFTDYINLVLYGLRKLCTLNILNWPQRYKAGKGKGYYFAKNAALARIAAAIFERYRNYNVDDLDGFDSEDRHTCLEVVAFGVDEKAPSSAR